MTLMLPSVTTNPYSEYTALSMLSSSIAAIGWL